MAENLSKKTLVGAFFDFVILVSIVGAAGFGGYFWGINQKLAPVQLVAPGTPGAVSATGFVIPHLGNLVGGKSGSGASANSANAATTPSGTVNPDKTPADETDKNKSSSSSAAAVGESSQSDKPAKSGDKSKTKYWLSSSGADYCGYSITVQVNNHPVDSFFGPDKLVDVTRLVHKGPNTLQFEAKALGEQYNKHPGDKNYALTIKLVKGPHVQDDYQAKDVLTTYSRNAAETQDLNDTVEFAGD